MFATAAAATSTFGTKTVGSRARSASSSSRSPARSSSPGKPSSPTAARSEDVVNGQPVNLSSPRSRSGSPKAADKQPGSPLREPKAPGSPLRTPGSPGKGLSPKGDAVPVIRGKAIHDPAHGAVRKLALHSAAASSKAAAAARVAAAVAAAQSGKGKAGAKKAAASPSKQTEAAAAAASAAAAAAAAQPSQAAAPAAAAGVSAQGSSSGGKATSWGQDPAFKAAIQVGGKLHGGARVMRCGILACTRTTYTIPVYAAAILIVLVMQGVSCTYAGAAVQIVRLVVSLCHTQLLTGMLPLLTVLPHRPSPRPAAAAPRRS